MPVIISRLRYLLTTVYIHYIIPQLAGNGGIPLIFALKVETYVISSLTHVQAKRDRRACPKQKLLLFVIYIYTFPIKFSPYNTKLPLIGAALLLNIYHPRRTCPHLILGRLAAALDGLREWESCWIHEEVSRCFVWLHLFFEDTHIYV